MFAWRRLLGLGDNEQTSGKKLVNLVEVADQARRDWLYAQYYYKTVTDPDLIEYATYLIKAYERKYIYLIKRARQEGIRYPNCVSLSEIIETKTVRGPF